MVLVQQAATVDRLRDEIQGVRYREATDTFCRLVTEADRPLKAMIRDRRSPRRRPTCRCPRT